LFHFQNAKLKKLSQTDNNIRFFIIFFAKKSLFSAKMAHINEIFCIFAA